MELKLCPSCDAFVGADWTECRSCGHDLGSFTPEEPEIAPTDEAPESVEPAKYQGEHARDNAAQAETASPSSEVHQEPAPSSPDSQGSPGWAPEERDPLFPQAFPFRWDPPSAATVLEGDSSQDSQAPEGEPAPTDTADSAPDTESSTTEVQAAAAAESTPAVDAKSGPQFAWEAPTQNAAAASITTDASAPKAQPLWMNLNLHETSRAIPKERRFNGKIIFRTVTTLTGVAALIVVATMIFGAVQRTHDVNARTAPTTIPGAADWVHYTDPGQLFKVDLPNQPSRVSYSTAAFGGTAAQSTTANGQTTVQILATGVTPSASVYVADQNLRDYMQADAQRLNAKIRSFGITQIDGRRELSALYLQDETLYNVRYFVSGSTLYVINVATLEEEGDPQTFGLVEETFRVLH